MKEIILLVVLFLSIQEQSLIANDSLFLNYKRIAISSKTIVIPTETELEWGSNLLNELEIKGKSNFEKAQTIERYVSKNYKYRIKSPRTIQGIINKSGGNCVSHTIMGLFLLRLSGVPAKLCYEFHVKNYFIIDQWRAFFQKAGHFGAGHNSHYWVMFFDGVNWQPYDSALDICGFEEFFTIRTKTQCWPYFLSFNPRRMTGAPFVVQQETGRGTLDMVNITKDIWSKDFEWNNSKVEKDEWLAFVESFNGMNTKDFIYPIENDLKCRIKRISKKWF